MSDFCLEAFVRQYEGEPVFIYWVSLTKSYKNTIWQQFRFLSAHFYIRCVWDLWFIQEEQGKQERYLENKDKKNF